jgi:hypothetical protein
MDLPVTYTARDGSTHTGAFTIASAAAAAAADGQGYASIVTGPGLDAPVPIFGDTSVAAADNALKFLRTFVTTPGAAVHVPEWA